MSLREFQTALGQMVRTTRRSHQPKSVALDDTEQACLDALEPTAALQFTRAVQRSWCKQRAANAAALTLSVLQDDLRRQLLDEWVDSGGGTFSFYGSEADALLEFIAGHLPDPSTELNVCRIEQSAIRASVHSSRFQPPDPASFSHERTLGRNPYAALVTALLIAPGLEAVHRVALPIEQMLWERLMIPAKAAVLLQEGYPLELLESLLRIGALEYTC